MDIRDILKSFDQLTEGDSTVHKAGPGGYGNRHGTDDVTDQYGKPIGQMSLGKLGAQNEPKRGKGRPPNPDKPKSYDSSALGKAMGMGKAPKPTGKPSVKHSLKEYFNQMDDALSEAGLAVQPMPATPAVKAQQQMATKPSFMIKDPANPNMPAITTQDPAVVQAAKNGTMSMQKPGAAPTAPGATPAAGAGSQVKPMGEDQLDELSKDTLKSYLKKSTGRADKFHNQGMEQDDDEEASPYFDKRENVSQARRGARDRLKGVFHPKEAPYGMREGGDVGKHNNATTGFDALVRKLTPKYGKEAATKIAGSQFQKMKEEDQSASDVFAKARNDKRNADDEMFAASKFGNKQAATDTFAKARNAKRNADDEMYAVRKGVAEADELRARGGLAAINKNPRPGQTDLRNIPAGNYPGSQNKFTDKDREEHPANLKAKIRATLGKHTRSNLPEQGVAEGEGFSGAVEQKVKKALLQHYGKGTVTFSKTSNGGYFARHEDDLFGDTHSHQYDPETGKIDSAHSSSQYNEEGVAEAEAPQYFAQSSPLSSNNRGVLESKKGVNPFVKKDAGKKKCPPMSHVKKMCQDGKSVAEICKMHPDCDQKELKQMVADCKKKLSEGAKPDFLDIDKDGNKKEPMKKAAADKNKGAAPKKGVNPFAKKKVKEGMEHNLQAARLQGKSHALRKMPYNCTNDDMEEARHYHDGFKEGLDECYGQMPILGRTAVGEMGQGPEVATMASYGADDMGEAMYDEGNAFTAGLAKTPHGGKFKVGGSSFTDNSRYDSNLDEFAFEALDKQLNAILEDKKVSEGMTVSISKGQQGSPDSVSVSAQDGEADQLLSIIKSAGMGLFGGDEQNGYGAPQGSAGAHGGISVVDDHDGMMALMKKLSGNGEVQGSGDYEDEEGSSEEGHMHGEEETCESCGGMMEENHQCDSGEQSVMGEDESEDQMAYEVAEANAPDSGADNTNADVAGNAAANSALATADAGQDEEEGQVYSSPTEGMEDTTGEEAGTDALDEEGYYKDPDGDDESAEDQEDKKDNEKRRREETVAESFANLYKKLAYLSEESTSEKDAKAEKAGKKVAKDIEYDEGDKGKDDNKAEKAGKKVTKDIEYDDKKDKKVDESYANSADDTFEADIDFMTKVITGGLNRQKSTGQTTIPVIAGQRNRMGADGLGSPMKESTDLLKDYMKLSGL